MFFIERLLKPLDYLSIQHQSKLKYDLVIPLVICGISSVVFYVVPIRPPIFGQNGLVALVNSLLQVLAGFFIASLAAVATFNKEGMDATMPGDPPTLKVVEKGRTKIIDLSRRRFLSLMFGYLAFLSLFLYTVGGLINLFANSVRPSLTATWIWALDAIFLIPYLFALSNLLVTTLLGLFYMSDRIHRPDSTVRHGSRDGGSD
jgi:hypothetical protein